MRRKIERGSKEQNRKYGRKAKKIGNTNQNITTQKSQKNEETRGKRKKQLMKSKSWGRRWKKKMSRMRKKNQ